VSRAEVEKIIARRVRAMREEHRRTSPLAGAVWPSGLEESAPTWGERALGVVFIAVGAAFVAALIVGLVAPDGCPPVEAVFGDAHACDAYVRDEAYWDARLGVRPDNANTDKE
jgi:hypothetical protein